MNEIVNNAPTYISALEINETAQDNPRTLVAEGEKRYYEQIRTACNLINHLDSCKIILLAGPSASGKTTTAHKFRTMLNEEYGIKSHVVSLDDFYINKCDLPLQPDGTRDLETVHALDIGLIHDCFKSLSETSKASFPIFDFNTSARSEKTNDIVLNKNEVLIVEGLHALNPLITEGLDQSRFVKLFISVKTEYEIDGVTVLTREDMRFIRRCVRDYNHRNSSLEETCSMWSSVRAGEKKYISPFKPFADFIIDSLMIYEPCIYHHYINPLIDEMDKTLPCYEKFKGIHDALEQFAIIGAQHIPNDSLLREFID